jgi:hypothetical protein
VQKRVLRATGRVVVAALGVVGLLAGAAVAAVVGAALGAGIGYALAARAGVPRAPHAVRFATGGGAGVFAVVGLVVIMGPWAVPMVGVAAAAVWRLRGSEPAVADLHRLSNAELGREWVRSYGTLRAARTADELDRVITLRRHQLDEIERSDVVGCREWLAGGAQGGSVPFLGT